ncbi:MAG: hypothetical protein ABI435_04110 [Pseudolysinimonas sp.]
MGSALDLLERGNSHEITVVESDAIEASRHSKRVRDVESNPDAISTKAVRGLVDLVVGLVNGDREEGWPFATADLSRDALLDGLKDILFELFENAFIHGSQTIIDGQPVLVERSLRFLRALCYSSNSELFDLELESPLRTYVQHSLRADQPRSTQLRLLEITIFDSGPGVAFKHLDEIEKGSTATFAEEVEAVAHALIKYNGTRSTLYFRSGQGLPRALAAISALRGFVRLRTGRVALYRDFAAKPLETGELGSDALFELKPELHVLEDWRGDGAPREYTRAAGTAYTIVVPIEAP